MVALWAGVALLGVDLLFFSGASTFLAAPQSRILNQVLLALVAAGTVIGWRRGAVDLQSPLVLPGLAWVAANLIAAAFSVRPATAWESMALLLLSLPGYLAVRAITWSPLFRGRLDRFLVIAAVAFTFAYLAQALFHWVTWWSIAGPSVPPLRPADAGLTVGTVNAVSLYLELLVPAGAWLVWSTWGRRPPAVALLGLGAFALLVTGSRGAWLGAAAGVLVAVALAWATGGLRRLRPPAGRARLLAVAGGALVAVVAVVAAPVLVTRLLGGDAGRFELWRAALDMVAAHPVTGVGPGGYPLVRPESPISTANLAVLTTSHSSILQVLAETGIAGLAAAALATLACVRLARHAIRSASDAGERDLRIVAVASLAAMAVHSVVDVQFHLPAVMLLVFLLLARLDPPAAVDVAPFDRPGVRRALPFAGVVAVALGALALVPVDLAMVRAEFGNLALDRDDAATALTEFRAATGLHELAPYRVGEGIAAAATGDAQLATVAFRRAVDLEPLTFIRASLAAVSPDDRAVQLAALEAAGPYDPGAAVNAAVLRFPGDRAVAIDDLAGAMAGAPTLVFSTRPAGLFDDAAWVDARREAIERISATDPVTGAAVAILAGEADLASAVRAAILPGPESDALDLLAGVAAGIPDVERARALLRASPASQGVQNVLWLMGFAATSQVLIDEVQALSIVAFFGVPLPPVELVTDGFARADWSLRLPRWPMASDARHAPKRPYPAGMITIEPVYRPKP